MKMRAFTIQLLLEKGQLPGRPYSLELISQSFSSVFLL
jgi:hypothetical protein